MNGNLACTVVFALILTALSPAAAQTSAPASAPAASQTPQPSTLSTAQTADPQSSNRAPRDASGDSDARHCLDLAANPEIIACAEKYRSHRSRK